MPVLLYAVSTFNGDSVQEKCGNKSPSRFLTLYANLLYYLLPFALDGDSCSLRQVGVRDLGLMRATHTHTNTHILTSGAVSVAESFCFRNVLQFLHIVLAAAVVA